MVHIVTLMNDTPSQYKNLETERGLSILVEFDNLRLLFDTGYDALFLDNAERLGYSLSDLDAVILSHSHFDHVAGYKELLERKMAPGQLFLGKHFFEPKYIQNGQSYVNMNSSLTREFMKPYGMNIKEVGSEMKLANGMYIISCGDETTSSIPSNHLRLTATNRFVRDNYDDEIALVMESSYGMIVVTGSCHHGLGEVVDKVHETFRKPVYAIIGGMNITESEKPYLDEKLLRSGVQLVAICNDRCRLTESCFRDIAVTKVAVGEEFFFD